MYVCNELDGPRKTTTNSKIACLHALKILLSLYTPSYMGGYEKEL
jgi:hypothetical protein